MSDPFTERKGYREPDEAPDGRPMVVHREIYKSVTEQLVYEDAAETNPRKPGEGPGDYIVRLAGIAAEKLGQIKPRPMKDVATARLPYRDADDVLMRLREQADAIQAKRTA